MEKLIIENECVSGCVIVGSELRLRMLLFSFPK